MPTSSPPTSDVYGAIRFRLPDDVSARFHAFTAARRVNGPAIVEAAWGLVLAAFSGTTDVVFGSTRGLPALGPAGQRGRHGAVHQHPTGAGDDRSGRAR